MRRSRSKTSDSEYPSYFVRSGLARHHPRGTSMGLVAGFSSARVEYVSWALREFEERPDRSDGCKMCGASTNTVHARTSRQLLSYHNHEILFIPRSTSFPHCLRMAPILKYRWALTDRIHIKNGRHANINQVDPCVLVLRGLPHFGHT